MPNPWKPSVTVAAVIERDGRFLLVEEQTADGVRLNQPAGHLDPGEAIVAGAARETLEETAFAFTPTQLVGVYLWRTEAPAGDEPTTYLRFAFSGELGAQEPGRTLDHDILRTLWLTREEIAGRCAEHRSPLVQRCIDDYLRGDRYPLELLYTHPSALFDVAPAQAGAQVVTEKNAVPACAGTTDRRERK